MHAGFAFMGQKASGKALLHFCLQQGPNFCSTAMTRGFTGPLQAVAGPIVDAVNSAVGLG